MSESPTIEQVTRSLVGVDASRRVGWAKYYESADQLDEERVKYARLLGLSMGTCRAMLTDVAAWKKVRRWLYQEVEGLLREREAAEAFGSGYRQGFRFAVPISLTTPTEDKVRCPNCNRLLFNLLSGGGRVSIRCTRCKDIVEVKF